MSIEDTDPRNDRQTSSRTFRPTPTRISKGAASKQQAEAARLLPIIAEALVVRKSADSMLPPRRKLPAQKDMADARAKKHGAAQGDALKPRNKPSLDRPSLNMKRPAQ